MKIGDLAMLAIVAAEIAAAVPLLVALGCEGGEPPVCDACPCEAGFTCIGGACHPRCWLFPTHEPIGGEPVNPCAWTGEGHVCAPDDDADFEIGVCAGAPVCAPW